MTHEEIMNLGADKARKTMRRREGGPFGAVIVKDGEIISIASNTVLKTHDPTAHAEVNAIRKAGEKLGTHDLTGCEIYCTSAPCPMCLSAIIWSNIKKVYYSGSAADTEESGFRDKFMYDYFRTGPLKAIVNKEYNLIEPKQVDKNIAQKLHKEYKEISGEIY